MKRVSVKIRKEKNRAERQLRHAALTAEFLLIGGHKDWLAPFWGAWASKLKQQIAAIESGDRYFTKPRNKNDTFYYDESTYTRPAQSF